MRETTDAIERVAIERGGAEVKRADLVVLVLDASTPVTKDQHWLIHAHRDAIVVWNKSDVSADGTATTTDDGIRTVATTGEGVDALRKAIRKRFGCETFDETRPRWWTERQRSLYSAPGTPGKAG